MSSPVDDSAVSALVESDWAQFTAHVRQIANLEEREQFWRQIGRAHGHGVDLFERLLAWPHEDCRNALRYLAPATAHGNCCRSASRMLPRRCDRSRTRCVKHCCRRSACGGSFLGALGRHRDSIPEQAWIPIRAGMTTSP